MGHRPFVSLILPCRQEEKYIAQTLDSILANDYPREDLEVLVVDGMSTDGTREVIADYARRHGFIKLLDNPKKITPAALNLGIDQARGQIIMRLDCHSVYPPHYISSLVTWLEKSGADNVGGVCVNLHGSEAAISKAIAVALSHPFGVGNAYFRIGAKSPRWVDAVPFGCFRRELFQRLGTFDESLVRNEDDEFNLRLLKQGGRVLLIPDLRVQYYTRETLAQVWRMYYQYGYFKTLVARKLGCVLRWRHIIPSLFVLSLVFFFLGGLWFPLLRFLGALILSAYILADLTMALGVLPQQGAGVAACLALVFPALHFSYGLGFLKGVIDLLVFRQKGGPDAERVPLSR